MLHLRGHISRARGLEAQRRVFGMLKFVIQKAKVEQVGFVTMIIFSSFFACADFTGGGIFSDGRTLIVVYYYFMLFTYMCTVRVGHLLRLTLIFKVGTPRLSVGFTWRRKLSPGVWGALSALYCTPLLPFFLHISIFSQLFQLFSSIVLCL